MSLGVEKRMQNPSLSTPTHSHAGDAPERPRRSRSHPLLEELQDKRVYFERLGGNHGDKLLQVAAWQLLEQGGVRETKSLDEAELVLLNGGGSMIDGRRGFEVLCRYNRHYPDIPLVVWPQSFLGDPERLASAFAPRRAPAWLWAREPYSLELLKAVPFPGTVHVNMYHDLALNLADDPAIRSLDGVPVADSLLVVERRDWEGATPRRRDFKAVPRPLRRLILGAANVRGSPFARAARRLARRRHPELALTPIVADISRHKVCDFEQFLFHCARARVIVTTRLHVAILGHLLGKTTYLVEGAYHKFRGVFEYSLKGGPVELARWRGSRLEIVSPG